MQLHSLTLNNVGVYGGAQTVRFSNSKTKPITLIGGKNGTGKTSLLDSIPLLLYGNRARQILNGVAYPEYLHGLVHHGERSASVVLEFDRTEDGQPVRYVVERSWKRTSRGRSTDQLSVTTDQIPRTDLVAAWPEFVEGIMPMAVADLTIFDAEKIESLADPTSSAAVLRTSLFGLLGLDLVDRLRSDLQNYRRRAAKAHDSSTSSDLGRLLAEAEIELADAIDRREVLAQALDVAESAKADLLTSLQQATDQLALAGGGLHAERETLNHRLTEASVAGDTVEHELFQLAASELPLTLCPDLLKAVSSAGDQKDAAALAIEVRATLEERNVRLADRVAIELGLSDEKAAAVRELLKTDLETIELPPAPAFSPTHDAAESARALLHHRASDLRADARRLTGLLSEHHAEGERLERMLAAAPDADGIAATVQRVATVEAELRVAEKATERALTELGGADRQVEQAQRSVDAIAHQVLNAGAADANVARIAREISDADSVLTEFADHMIRKHLGRITNEINSALQQLLRKSSLIAGVSIDPSDLSVTLLDAVGNPFDAKRLSAGERQIMATAVLWGLSRCTGMTLPTIIDTPVGRLDRSHRTNLVERYFPHASRQVVLLSTDEEIVGTHLDLLMPKVGAQYRLNFDEAEARTSIDEGYFDE